MQEQSRELQRKLSQLQLEDMTKKDKDKKKQAVFAEPGTMTPIVQQAPPQEFSPLPQQPQSQRSPAPPVVNVYTQNSGNGKKKAAGSKVELESQYIVIGPQGAAMTAQDADQSTAI